MSNTAEVSKNENSVTYRIVALIFAVIGIASLFIPYTYVMHNLNVPVRTSFFASFIDLFKSEETQYLFGFIPTHAPIFQDSLIVTPNVRGIVTAIIYYVFILMIFSASITGIVAGFSKKKSKKLLNVSVFIFLFAYSMYALWHTVYILTVDKKILLDYVCISGTAIFFVTSIVLALARKGKKTWFSILQFALSLIASSILILAIEADTDYFKNAFAAFGITNVKLQDLIVYALVTLCALNILSAYVRIQVKKGIPFEIVRFVLQILILGFACYIEFVYNTSKNKAFAFFCVIATLISIVQIILCFFQCNKVVKAKKEEKALASAKEAVAYEYYAETHVEAVPYNGGPINGVETAELAEEDEPTESNNTEAGASAVADTEEDPTYDFYNSKSYDPFVATLTKKEKVEFTDLFVLRCKGEMPEIPEYVVGEPKKAFFNKVFISLGKYRDKISDELLSKIYEFSLKLK